MLRVPGSSFHLGKFPGGRKSSDFFLFPKMPKLPGDDFQQEYALHRCVFESGSCFPFFGGECPAPLNRYKPPLYWRWVGAQAEDSSGSKFIFSAFFSLFKKEFSSVFLEAQIPPLTPTPSHWIPSAPPPPATAHETDRTRLQFPRQAEISLLLDIFSCQGSVDQDGYASF